MAPITVLAVLVVSFVAFAPRDAVHVLRGLTTSDGDEQIVIITKAQLDEVYRAGVKATLDRLDTQGCIRGQM